MGRRFVNLLPVAQRTNACTNGVVDRGLAQRTNAFTNSVVDRRRSSVDDDICEGISPLGYWQKVTQSPTQKGSVDDAICKGISPLGYWKKVNQSPTQTKPYNTEVRFFQVSLFSPAKKINASSLMLVVCDLRARLGASKFEKTPFLRLNK